MTSPGMSLAIPVAAAHGGDHSHELSESHSEGIGAVS